LWPVDRAQLGNGGVAGCLGHGVVGRGLRRAWREQLRSGWKNLLLGAAMSVFLLARLDNVIAIAPCVLLLAGRQCNAV